jgi:transcriptional regulator GlxA family with amidase domain
LVVAGGAGVHDALPDAALVKWVGRRAGVARRVASVCTGAFLLAEAGLLDGRRCATHWRRCEELARRYPSLRVESDPIFVRDGDVWTSAGVTSGIDLTLAFVEADLGRSVALAVARQLVVFAKRPGGQAQFSAGLSLSGDADFDALHDWMRGDLSRDLSVPRLAARARMS